MRTVLMAAALMLAAGAGGAAADPVAGLWKTQPGDSGGYLHVAIAPCGAAICGTIKAAYDAQGKASGDYEHLGKRIIWDMGSGGNGKYAGGKIWAPDTNKTYNSKMQMSGGSLKVSGCVGPICRSQTWTRLK